MNTAHLPEQKERISYTVTELGALTGLSVRTWWRLVREGAVPTIRVGERVLVPHAAVIEFMEKRLDKTGAPLRQPPEHIQRRIEKAAAREAELSEVKAPARKTRRASGE